MQDTLLPLSVREWIGIGGLVVMVIFLLWCLGKLNNNPKDGA